MLGKMKGPFSGSSHVSFRRKTAKNRNFWGRRRPTTAEGDEGDAGRVAQHFTNSGSFPIPSPRVSSPEMDRVASVFFRLSLSRNWCPERHDFFQESGDGHFRHHPIKHHIVEYHDQQTIMQHLKLSFLIRMEFLKYMSLFWETSMFLTSQRQFIFPLCAREFFPLGISSKWCRRRHPQQHWPIRRTDRTIGSDLQNGIIFGWHFFHAISMDHIILVTWAKTKSRHFPTIFGRLFGPGDGIQNEFKIPKITKHKKKSGTIEPKVISCGTFWSSPYWLENSFQDRYTHCLFLLGENIHHLKLDNFRKHAPPPKKTPKTDLPHNIQYLKSGTVPKILVLLVIASHGPSTN